MSFFKTPVRRLCLVRAWGNLLLFVAFVALSFAVNSDKAGSIFIYSLCAVFLGVSLYNFWLARRIPAEAMEELLPELPDAARDQISYFRRLRWISLVAFPILSGWIVYDLNLLESGAEKSVEIWAPVSFVYDYLGYWPAVLTAPFVGVFCLGVFTYILRKLALPYEKPVKNSLPGYSKR